MATLTLSRSDLFPPGTTVSIRAAGSKRDGQAPCGAEVASGTVDAAGALSVTSGSVLSLTSYVCYALVGAEHRYAMARSTLDLFDVGGAVGTGDTANAANTLLNVSASAGAFRIGQRITGPKIPPGTYLVSGSGASWVMSANATGNGSGVALKADSGLTWRATVKRRRAAIGTV